MLLRLLAVLLLLSSGPTLAEPRTFSIDPGGSSIRVHVGKTGIASFAGHEHEVAARSLQGEVAADFNDLPRSSVEVFVGAGTLSVEAEGEPEGDAPKVEQAMKGPGVLDAGRFPAIRFRSREVSGKQIGQGSYELTVSGDLSLHGAEHPAVVPLRVDVQGDQLTATGKFVIRQSDFGIEPTTAAGGLVRVEDEVTVTFRIVARSLERKSP